MASKNTTILVSGESITLENLLEQIEKTKRQRSELKTQIDEIEGKLRRIGPEFISLENQIEKLQTAHEIFDIKQKIKNFNNDITRTENQTYPWSEQVQDVLNNVFKLKEFRPKQKSAIDILLNLKDLLVVMPTGAGKSLLYQLPAYIENGFSVVVSPLKLLIDDQMRILKQIRLNAVALNSSTNATDKKTIFTQMLDKKSDLKLVYVTPEWLVESNTFLNYLQKAEKVGRLKRIVIDEVHCRSELGHDFREDYEYLGILRATFSKIPFLGLTATTTMNILNDVQKKLSMQNSVVITASLNRPNLYYKTIYKSPISEESINQVFDLLENYSNQRGIIYCNTIEESINLTKKLSSRGYKCNYYHDEMMCDDHKDGVYNEWVNKQSLIIIASEAFDIGIHMPDVRFVIHYCMPPSIANLYQQTGRAGRDGQRADCIIMHNLFDYLNDANKPLRPYHERINSMKMLDYCLTDYCCKRKLMLNYFEEEWHQDHCKQMCDYCEQPSEMNLIDITHYYKRICKILSNASDQLKLNILLDKWLNGPFKSKLSRENAEYIIAHLILREYLGIILIYTPNGTIDYITKGEEYFNGKIMIKTSRVFNSIKKRRNVNYKTRSARRMKPRK